MKIGFVIDDKSQEALQAAKNLLSKYDLGSDSIIETEQQSNQNLDFDYIITIGGDGVMLKALRYLIDAPKNIPVYGMNMGSIGFLLNDYAEDNLIEKLQSAHRAIIHPLEMEAINRDGERFSDLAINEVSLMREYNQAAKLKISIDGKARLDCLICDGIITATPAGSTAYNLAAHGPIIPLESNLLALTPISPFRPRRWRGALIPKDKTIEFEILEHEKRPVSAAADSCERRHITYVSVRQRSDIELQLLFDPHNGFTERVIKEQFAS